MTSQTSLHERLRSLRHQAHFTLAQVSIGAGVSVSFLSDIERGRTLPSLPTLERIADVYRLTLGEVLVDVTTYPLDVVNPDDDRQPYWSRVTWTPDGEPVLYNAHAATDPQTVTALDELVRAAAAHMQEHAAEERETSVHSNVSVGQMVHYVLPNGECRAAIVVRVWENDMVNLYVLLDGKNDSHNDMTLLALDMLWATSVHHFDEFDTEPPARTWHQMH